MNQIKQGYIQTKVGVIPEDWEDIKIKDIAKVSQGLQIAIDNRFTTPAHNRVFYITIPFIEGKKEEYIENPKSSTLCKKDDILVVRTGSGVGKIIRGVEGAFHNNFFKVKPSNNINIDFFYYFLTLPRIQFLMAKYAGNSAIPDLNHGDFYSLDFLIPPLKEQEKIAEILITWDEAITKQTELIKAKELLKIALMQKLLSGEVRFSGFSDEWEEVKTIDVLSIGSGKDYKHLNNGNIPVYGTGGQMLMVDDYLYDGESVCIGRKGTIDKPQFLNGKFWTVDTLFYTHSYINTLPKFIFYIFQSINWYKYNEASGVPSLSKRTIEIMKIKLPSLPEQQKIAEVLSLSDDEINLLKNKLDELKLQKKALMQKLLTGEVRVKYEQ
jgi:type I restriction enzyme S subunit